MIHSRFFRNLIVVASLGAVYFVAGKLGLMMAFVHPRVTTVWPPSGIALAAILLLGHRVWPGILLGAFLVNMTTAGTVATSLGIAMGNTLEGLLGAYLVNRFANGCNAFNRAQDIFKFTVLAGMACTVAATFGVTSLTLGGFVPWANYGAVWLTWWLGDAVSALVVAPALILWSTSPRVQWNRAQIFEAGILVLVLVLIGHTVFSEIFSSEIKHYSLEFMSIPFLIWIAFRFGQREAATAIFVLSGIAILGTLRGFGPFVRDKNEPLFILQAFMGVMAVMTMVLAAVVSERKRAEEALQRAHDELEQRVQQRTEVLSSTNEVLRAEISERKRAEEALQDSKERFTAFMDNNPAVAWMKDENWNYVYINQPFERLFDVKLEGIIGKNDFEIWPEVTAKELRANDMLVLRSGKPVEIFETVPTPDGSPHYWLVFKFPIKDSSGRWFVGGMAVDITERRRLEQKLLTSENRLRTIIETEPECVKIVSPDGIILQMNAAGLAMCEAKTPEEIIGKPVYPLIASAHLGMVRALFESVCSGKSGILEYEIIGLKGTHRWMETYAVPFRGDHNEINGTLSVTRDITKRKQAEETLRKSESRFAGLLEIAQEAIISIDERQQIIIFNKRAEQIFGYSQDEAVGQSFDLLLPERFQTVHKNPIGVFAGSGVTAHPMGDLGAIYGRRKTGEEFPAEASISKLELGDEKIFTVVLRDITYQERWEHTLFKQAICDTLTGLYNRRYFECRMEEEIARADRNQHMLAILLCDLDHFKTINDLRGHQAGDEVLKEVARSIQESSRGTDLVFRWGGDEIVVILSKTTREGVLIASDRIREGIHKVSEAARLDLDLSIGAALYPVHGKNVDELIRLANRALNIAKKGGDKIHIGEEEYRLDEHSIKTVFQPVVDIGSNQNHIIGYEALTRDPEGKLSVFELFKKYGAIGQLNELKQLCFRTQMKVAQEVRLQRLFINVDFDLISKLEPMSKPPGMEVILEISELEALHDVENHLKVAKKWREKGYRYAIDDFGAGFISLPFIARLVPKYIKVDRSTMLQAVSSEKFRGFLKPLLQSLRAYAMEGIIAEGVETEKELKVVKDMGIHLVQGFLFGKPKELK